MKTETNKTPPKFSSNFKLLVDTGLINFSGTGRIELNKICRKSGLSKPSFYHIYPNSSEIRGTELLFLDIIHELNERLGKLLKLLFDILDSDPETDAPQKMLTAIEKYYIEFRGLSHLSLLQENIESQIVYQKFHNNLCTIKLRVFHDFYKNLPKEKALIICSSILKSGYSIASINPSFKIWKDHVISINKELYFSNYV